MSNKKKAYNLCRSAMEIQKILQRDNLDFVVWPNVEGKQCVFVIEKGDNPWQGVRVSSITQKVSFLRPTPKIKDIPEEYLD